MVPASLTSLGQVSNPVLLQTSHLSKETSSSFLPLPPVLVQSLTPLSAHPSGTPVRYSINKRPRISILTQAHLITQVVELYI